MSGAFADVCPSDSNEYSWGEQCQSPAAIAPGEIVAVGGDVLPRYKSDEADRQCSEEKAAYGHCQIGLGAEHLTKR